MAHFNQNVTAALKDAIVKVFWKKDDLRNLCDVAGIPRDLVQDQNWNLAKYKVISPIIDSLNMSESGIGPLRRILHETLSFKDGNHLLWCSDGQLRKTEAETSLTRLRELVKDHDASLQTEKEQQEAIRRRKEQASKYRDFNEKLASLKERFLQFHSKEDHNERGYDLETLLNELFALFDLAPRSPFSRKGEQIDGAFVLERDHYLVEAKWQKKKVNLSQLRDLDGAVGTSLDNTLGLFISVEGFTTEALEEYVRGGRPRIICMDGADLFMVLDGRIDLVDLLQRKKDVAVQKKEIFVTASDILLGKN